MLNPSRKVSVILVKLVVTSIIRDKSMKTITYLESNNRFFAPVEQILEALNNEEGVKGLSYIELLYIVAANYELAYYVENFDAAVIFTK